MASWFGGGGDGESASGDRWVPLLGTPSGGAIALEAGGREILDGVADGRAA